ncbi:MAG: metallophosphoesterase family protein [Candidatus Methanoplasma sp.]|jgi:Icc-related predicted phosphoesterase|nr:metallophosphoesterase family protein [Candidatus Methanoplasma sp.]
MKFLVVSDIHGNLSATEWINSAAERENADCVLALGDITDFGPNDVAERILGPVKKDVYAIPGNCDPLDLPEFVSEFTTDMHGRTTELGGFHIAGLGGSNPTIFNTPFELDEDTIYNMLRPISREGMILMVHAPAYGINDMIPSGLHVGSTSILKIVEEFRPILVLSGHIHEDYGIKHIDGTTFVNPGPAKDGMYAVVEADGGAVKAMLYTVSD